MSSGYEIVVNPKPVTLDCNGASMLTVRLELAPVPGSPVTVVIDSTAGAYYFIVSPCTLTFTSDNYNVDQTVYIQPGFSKTLGITTPVRPRGRQPSQGLA